MLRPNTGRTQSGRPVIEYRGCAVNELYNELYEDNNDAGGPVIQFWKPAKIGMETICHLRRYGELEPRIHTKQHEVKTRKVVYTKET